MSSSYLFCFFSGLVLAGSLDAQYRKVDTTAKMGDVGYKVFCSNKKPDNNPISISTIGFTGGSKPLNFYIKGTVGSIGVDDFNDDGFPDLVVFLYTNDSSQKASVICLLSAENKDITPVYFPDIYNDPKLREGYKGHDQFTIFAGTLLRTFPIYKPDDKDTPTGGKRVVQYKIAPGEGGRLVFKALRSYEKQE
jgi:hypothetical protein